VRTGQVAPNRRASSRFAYNPMGQCAAVSGKGDLAISECQEPRNIWRSADEMRWLADEGRVDAQHLRSALRSMVERREQMQIGRRAVGS
jgi:hypothetical protein